MGVRVYMRGGNGRSAAGAVSACAGMEDGGEAVAAAAAVIVGAGGA
jgi:hypothetical protein